MTMTMTMKTKTIGRAGLLALAAVLGASRSPAAAGEVSLRVLEPNDLLIGQPPVLKAEIRNGTDEPLRLVRPFRTGLHHRHYPKLTVEVIDPSGKPVPLDLRPGPNRKNELYESSFFTIAPGDSAPLEVRWPFEAPGLPSAGRYRLRLTYDTRAPSLSAWAPWPDESASPADNVTGRWDMVRMLEAVEKLVVVGEKDVDVHAVTPEAARDMLIGSLRDEEIATTLREAFTAGRATVTSIRPSRGVTYFDVTFDSSWAPPGEDRELRTGTWLIEPEALRPGVVAPLEGFRGGRFNVDPLGQVPLWRRKQLGLPLDPEDGF